MRNERGFTLVEVMISSFVMALITLGAATMMTTGMKIIKSSDSTAWLEEMRREIVFAMKNEASFRQTVLDVRNPSMTCLRDKALDPNAVVSCAGGGGPINVVRKEDMGTLLDSTLPTAGFDKMGKVCNEFDPTNGNDRCPFKYNLVWRAHCTGQGCSDPDVMVSGNLQVSFADKSVVLNPNLYKFSVYLNADGEQRQTTCEQSQLGAFDEMTQRCAMTISGRCPPGLFLTGYQNNGTPICTTLTDPITGQCPAGSRLRGVRGDGTAVCGPDCI